MCAGRLRRAVMASPATAARAGSASSGSSAGATPAHRSRPANNRGALHVSHADPAMPVQSCRSNHPEQHIAEQQTITAGQKLHDRVGIGYHPFRNGSALSIFSRIGTLTMPLLQHYCGGRQAPLPLASCETSQSAAKRLATFSGHHFGSLKG